jgi:hypothetical protein
MSSRLTLLSDEERVPYPYFTTEWLAETLGVSVKGIRKLARLEGWTEVERDYADHEGNVFPEPFWDGMTIPAKRLMEIAAEHYRQEEEEYSLAEEVRAAILTINGHAFGIDYEKHFKALYRTRQLAMVEDVVQSLSLDLNSGIVAISSAYQIPVAELFDLITVVCSDRLDLFIRQGQDVRFAILLHHFSVYPERLLPEADHTINLADTVSH